MQKRILCFGDSNTWGAIPNETARYAPDVRWTGVMQSLLGPDFLVIEEGLNGRTTVHDDPIERKLSGLTYFEPCCDSQSPLDLVILMLGTNDLKTRFNVGAYSIADGLRNYHNVLQTVRMAGSRPKWLIASPIAVDPAYREHPELGPMFGPDADARSLQFADAYRKYADSVGAYFFDAAAHAKTSKLDGIHMDPAEHANLGRALAEKVKEIFSI